MQKSLTALTSAFLALGVSQPAHAGAWLQDSDDTQAIFSYNYLSTGLFFDPAGNKFNNTIFTKGEISAYIEHGLTQDWTIGGYASLQSVSSNGASGNITDLNEFQLAYGEVFARHLLYTEDDYIISIEPRIKLPIEKDAGVNPEGSAPIPELKLSYGHALSIFSDYDSFSDVSITYRLRTDDAVADMIKLDAAYGIRPFTETPILFLAQSFYEKSLTNIQANPNAGNYDLLKFQLSAAYEYDENLTFQLGAYSNIYGKNTAAGEGILLSTWVSF